jgi:two-component system nitrate/nitrite response regulator NarL
LLPTGAGARAPAERGRQLAERRAVAGATGLIGGGGGGVEPMFVDPSSRCAILLVDPNRLWRDGLSRILTDKGFEICAEAGTLDEGLAQLAETGDSPALVLLDSAAVGADTETALEQIRTQVADARVVVFTDPDAPQTAVQHFLAGVNGCLFKNVDGDTIALCLNLVQLGERVFPSDLVSDLITKYAPLMKPGGSAGPRVSARTPQDARLSERECAILACLVNGASNKQIGLRFDLSESTVKVHLRNILRKIRASNRTQAAIWAMQHGLEDYAESDSDASDAGSALARTG